MKFKTIEGTSPVELDQLEAFTGFTLPAYLRDFFLQYAGGTIASDFDFNITTSYPNGHQVETYIERFEYPKTIQERWQYRGYLEEYAEDFELSTDFVEVEQLFPLAELPSGQLSIAIGGKHNGKVYTADNGDFGIGLVAASLEELFANFYP